MDIPFATKDGAIINWIESKAQFGNDETHEINLNQLRGYWNRYGTGLVIYWFGFISDLRISSVKEGILIKEAFPADDQIILMNSAHDIYEELPSNQSSLEILDKNDPLNISDINDSSVQTLENVSEMCDSAALTVAISKVTKAIENTIIK